MNRNTIKTFTFLAGLAGLLVLAGQLLGGTGGAVVGLFLGLVLVGGSYWFSDRIAVRAARAVPLERWQAPDLHAMVDGLAVRAGIAAPRLYVSPSAQPNAFATGRNERTAVIAVTQGLLDELTARELGGVVAHEMAHIANRDILIGSVAAAVATGISMIANMAMFSSMLGGGDEDAPNPLAVMLGAMVAPVAAGLLHMAVSRSREYEADRIGAHLLDDPTPLADALAKIEDAVHRRPMEVAPAQTSHYIVNPLTGTRANFAQLFMTHPPTGQRIARLLGTAVPARQPDHEPHRSDS